MSDPIIPSRIIPAGEPLPAPAPAAPPPPVPPAPRGSVDPDPDWWRTGSGPAPDGSGSASGPPEPPVVHVHVTYEQGGPLAVPDPDPGPPWYRRILTGRHLACAAAGFALCGPWAWVLASVRDEEGLAGAWVMALLPLCVVAYVDNVRQSDARTAAPDLWAPRIRAFTTRSLLWAGVFAIALTLPVTTLVYVLTGVKPS
ncbi:hypothetical protein [Streptomyces fructofermentans]|uniref:hypothetical protein n=1 Tax=Streptomyces fructofermentans TaxID=152141 RepID=UPI00167A3D8E|nr:hypothetical protein [Streptomyces fructofermentans]